MRPINMNKINCISLYIIAFSLLLFDLNIYFGFINPSFSYFDVIFSCELILFCMGPLLVLLLIEYRLMTSGKPDFNKDLRIL